MTSDYVLNLTPTFWLFVTMNCEESPLAALSLAVKGAGGSICRIFENLYRKIVLFEEGNYFGTFRGVEDDEVSYFT
ncbi:hypothetical protein TNCT_276031 [Trichonephila clavata]|uniref:Uncharacterized protein n=1 Tax=Trichonephila clavata TaxID=2740835 RepID=A0A8X6F3Z5_TRICU|nr:hypothetical protein TNCT_276031 [Trichonephila clavata]